VAARDGANQELGSKLNVTNKPEREKYLYAKVVLNQVISNHLVTSKKTV